MPVPFLDVDEARKNRERLSESQKKAQQDYAHSHWGRKDRSINKGDDMVEVMTDTHEDAVSTNQGEETQNTPKERLKWYQDNKKQMIADLIELGNTGFLKKWNVKGQFISHLKTDPLYKKQATTTSSKVNKQVTQNRTTDGISQVSAEQSLPPFPLFSDNWHEAVQIEWFKTYRALKGVANAA